VEDNVLLFQVEVVEHPEKKRRVTIPSLDSEALQNGRLITQAPQAQLGQIRQSCEDDNQSPSSAFSSSFSLVSGR